MALDLAIESVTVTADGTAYTGKGDFYGVAIAGGGDAIVYDNTAASGTIICAADTPGIMLPSGCYRRFATGLHVDLTTATEVTVYFVRR